MQSPLAVWPPCRQDQLGRRQRGQHQGRTEGVPTASPIWPTCSSCLPPWSTACWASRRSWDRLEVHPCLPADWPHAEADILYRGRRHHVAVDHGKVEVRPLDQA